MSFIYSKVLSNRAIMQRMMLRPTPLSFTHSNPYQIQMRQFSNKYDEKFSKFMKKQDDISQDEIDKRKVEAEQQREKIIEDGMKEQARA